MAPGKETKEDKDGEGENVSGDDLGEHQALLLEPVD